MTLQEPLDAYFSAKNQRNIDAMLAPFATDATVKDEGQEMHGHTAIRAWMEETTRKYGVTVEAKGVEAKDGGTVVTALVSGNFPGSPAELRYSFQLGGGKIARLEIG
jgi:hypothetical protein